MGKFAVRRLKVAYKEWTQGSNDADLLATVTALAKDFAKEVPGADNADQPLCREELELICFEYVSS